MCARAQRNRWNLHDLADATILEPRLRLTNTWHYLGIKIESLPHPLSRYPG
jgi:hypothetical protein